MSPQAGGRCHGAPKTTSPITKPTATAARIRPRTRQSLSSGFLLSSFTAGTLPPTAGLPRRRWVESPPAKSATPSVTSLARYARPSAEALARWQERNDPARRR
jgi:hypothetical protein